MIWVGIWNGIRTQRVAVLNISFDIVVPVDEHRPEDLILILCLVLLTVPMIHGKRTHSKRDHLLYNVCPSAIGVVLVLLPSHSLGPKAVIVASGARVIQVWKETVDPGTVISIVAEKGSIEIDRLHLMIVNVENAKKRRERRTRR